MKQSWRPGNMVYPVPAMLVSCGATPEEYNVFTASWVGTICSDPAMCYVSIRPSRHSYDIVKRNMAFTLNLSTEQLAQATDWCGVRSGRDYNKFEEIVHLGSHDMFIADVVNVLADQRYIDSQTGEFDLKKARLIAYSHGEYFKLGERIGKFGWTVKKK